MSHQPDGKNMQQDFCCNHLSQPTVGKDLDHGHCDLDFGMVPHHDHYYSLILVNILMLHLGNEIVAITQLNDNLRLLKLSESRHTPTHMYIYALCSYQTRPTYQRVRSELIAQTSDCADSQF